MPDPRLSSRAILFLALVLAVCLLNGVRGMRITRSVAAQPPLFAAELDRFAAARTHLGSADSAVVLFEPSAGRRYGKRFFAAQYSLAPTVLSLAFRIDEIAWSNSAGNPRPILCVADDPTRQKEMLSSLEAAARERGWTLFAEPIDDLLTVVRLGGS